jgi:hypothetical protein
MSAKTGPWKQPSTIKCIQVIANTHGYIVQSPKKDPKVSADKKKFLPDVVAQPFKGKGKRVFKVETKVTRNTIYKSLMRLLTSLQHGAEAAYLVVPGKHHQLAAGCFLNLKSVIRHYSKSAIGDYPKINLEVLGFSEIAEHYAKARNFAVGGQIGQPPKCPFLPRSKTS